MTKSDRWRVALHEASHGVAAIALGGECDGLVVFADGSGGSCQCGDLDPSKMAYNTAAGPIGEILAERYPIPETPIADRSPKTCDELESSPIYASSPMLACAIMRTADTRKHVDSDSRQLALWAISGGYENQPETWQRRVALAKRVAAEIVEDNAAKIARVATALYVRGALSRDEITTLFQGTTE